MGITTRAVTPAMMSTLIPDGFIEVQQGGNSDLRGQAGDLLPQRLGRVEDYCDI